MSRLKRPVRQVWRGFLAAVTVALLDYAERWMRPEIAAIPDGVYEFEDYLEDDGVDAGPLNMQVKVPVDGNASLLTIRPRIGRREAPSTPPGE